MICGPARSWSSRDSGDSGALCVFRAAGSLWQSAFLPGKLARAEIDGNQIGSAAEIWERALAWARVVRELTRALALSFQAKIWKFIGFYN